MTEAERRPTRRWGLALSVHWQGPGPGGGRGNRDVNFRHQYLNMFDLFALLLCSLFALQIRARGFQCVLELMKQ